jgi:hypothetical protein
MVVGMERKAAPMPVSFRNTLTRKRPPSAETYEKSALAQGFQLRLGQHFCDVAFQLGFAEVTEFDGREVPMHAQHGRHADRQMQV